MQLLHTQPIVGSSPTITTSLLGVRQAVRQRILIPSCIGSIPIPPASYTALEIVDKAQSSINVSEIAYDQVTIVGVVHNNTTHAIIA